MRVCASCKTPRPLAVDDPECTLMRMFGDPWDREPFPAYSGPQEGDLAEDVPLGEGRLEPGNE